MGPPINIFQYVVILGVTISGHGATHNVYTPNLSQHIVISALYKKKGNSQVFSSGIPFRKERTLIVILFCRSNTLFKPFPEPIMSAIWEAERLIGRGRPCPHILGIHLPPRTREIWGLPWITIYIHAYTHIYIYIHTTNIAISICLFRSIVHISNSKKTPFGPGGSVHFPWWMRSPSKTHPKKSKLRGSTGRGLSPFGGGSLATAQLPWSRR